ncbi:MAG: response regulator transcription factor [Acidobacteriota bacterium]|nr:MAG: response regulator transcription factor [Acidobacteriota bacterium]
MNVLVVDDERVARHRLIRLLDKIDTVTVVGEAADGEEAREKIRELDPDLVLLDIRMPGIDGLELALTTPDMPHVIFTTAYEEYAVRAFEASAIDYLLKPIEADRLSRALEKARLLDQPQDRRELERLLQQMLGAGDPPRITARRGETLRVFDPREIARFTAREGYTAFRHEGREYLLENSITSLEERLGKLGFLRVHRRELVNLSLVRAITKQDEATVVELASGERALVSRRQVSVLKERLGIAGSKSS